MKTVFQVQVKELRQQTDLTQEELADKLGISRQSVIALERGRSLPSLPIALLLAEVFARPLSEIFVADPAYLSKSVLPVICPPVNLLLDGYDLVLEAAVPGYNRKEVKVTVEPDAVSIAGRPQPAKRRYLTREHGRVSFERRVVLPLLVDPAYTTAAVKNGLLVVRAPIVRSSKKEVIISA